MLQLVHQMLTQREQTWGEEEGGGRTALSLVTMRVAGRAGQNLDCELRMVHSGGYEHLFHGDSLLRPSPSTIHDVNFCFSRCTSERLSFVWVDKSVIDELENV